jgi:tellurite resistance protein
VKLDDNKLREVLKTIAPGAVSPGEAAAIIDIARFAASVDGRMDMSEMATVARVSKIIHAMSGEPNSPVPSTQMAEGWLADIPKRLPAAPTRELAYAVAHLIVITDGKITNEESALRTKLAEVLRIAADRARGLEGAIDAIVVK